MFMTAEEITKHFKLGDAGDSSTKDLMEYKLQDSKHSQSHDGKTSLYESIKSEGVKKPVEIETSPYVDRPILVNGHHRLASAHNLNPKQFLPLTWDHW